MSKMLVWSSRIYLDERIARRKKKYKKLLEKNKRIPSVYCITLPINGENIMEIYSSREFWFQYYRDRKMVLIGLAKTGEAAKRLAAQICLDLIQRHGEISPALVEEYFLQDKQELSFDSAKIADKN